MNGSYYVEHASGVRRVQMEMCWTDATTMFERGALSIASALLSLGMSTTRCAGSYWLAFLAAACPNVCGARWELTRWRNSTTPRARRLLAARLGCRRGHLRLQRLRDRHGGAWAIILMISRRVAKGGSAWFVVHMQGQTEWSQSASIRQAP